jgi:hypothetical protein
MYCPRCGQEQLSPEVRFCSRCGFNLRTVSHLLPTGGLMPIIDDSAGEMTPRQKGMRFGAKILFASLVMLPIAFALSVAIDTPAPLLLFVLPFLAGALRMLYARLFEASEKRWVGYHPAFEAPPRGAALPAYQPPVYAPERSRTTGELVEPPSVTEHTTRFLDKRPSGAENRS